MVIMRSEKWHNIFNSVKVEYRLKLPCVEFPCIIIIDICFVSIYSGSIELYVFEIFNQNYNSSIDFNKI